MDLLMSLGITIAYFSSIAALGIDAAQKSNKDSKATSSYFDAVVFLSMFLLIGRLIEAYSKAKAGDAVTLLGKLRPTEATLIESIPTKDPDAHVLPTQRTRIIPVDLLENGDTVRISNGGSPPYDGVVIEGTSQFDESSLTGESKVVPKTIGSDVFSGTINKGSPVSIRINRAGGNSMLDQIIAAVREGQTRRAPIERLADVLTSYFVPIVTFIAVVDWIIWMALGLSNALPVSYKDTSVGGWPFWSLQFAIAVFVIACPCGIGLAAPTALFVGGGLAAKHGILVKGGGEAFQEASHLDCIVFDKTGTLTQGGEPAVTDHEFLGERMGSVLGAMRKLEESSNHPIAKAVVSFCDKEAIEEVRTVKMEEIPGKGISGTFSIQDGTQQMEILVGNEALLLDYLVDISNSSIATLESWKGQGKSVVLVATKLNPTSTTNSEPPSWTLSVILAAADPLRPEASSVIQSLHLHGIEVWMISGDNITTARSVGAMVGIPQEHIIAGVLPDQKSDKIRYLQKSRHKKHKAFFRNVTEEDVTQRAIVAMVGDGINDSPALTTADVGIAIGSGSDIAISSAEFVLITSRLTSLLTLIDLSRTVFNRIKFNFGWALVYNLVALPVAAGVLYPIKSNGTHVRLDPVWASLAMALSSVSVVCSSLLMRSELPVVGFRKRKLRVRGDKC
jgi:heavy metal translocating P-type ATPase